MAARRSRPGISYGELAEYEACVEEVRKAGIAIAQETRYYAKENNMLISDGDLYASNVRAEIARMQKALRKIDAMSKKYGRD